MKLWIRAESTRLSATEQVAQQYINCQKHTCLYLCWSKTAQLQKECVATKKAIMKKRWNPMCQPTSSADNKTYHYYVCSSHLSSSSSTRHGDLELLFTIHWQLAWKLGLLFMPGTLSFGSWNGQSTIHWQLAKKLGTVLCTWILLARLQWTHCATWNSP